MNKTKLWVCGVLLLLCLPFQAAIALQYDALRWEEQIKDFESADKLAPPSEGAILFIGSSSIWFWHETLKDDMPGLTVIPRGFGGSTMLDVLNYSDRIVYPYKPRAIVLYEGDNDISSYAVPLSIIEARYRDFIKELRSRQPETRLYMLAIKPSIARWHDWVQVKQMNSMFKALCAEDDRLIYVDIATPMLNDSGEPRTDIFLEDDLHMNKNGYKIWTSVVYPLLRDREGQYEASL